MFENGATGIHTMVGGTSYGTRTIRITGTKAEIFGDFEKGEFTLSKIDPRPGCEHEDTVFDLKVGDAISIRNNPVIITDIDYETITYSNEEYERIEMEDMEYFSQ